jgi:hypothetical protein
MKCGEDRSSRRQVAKPEPNFTTPRWKDSAISTRATGGAYTAAPLESARSNSFRAVGPSFRFRPVA